MKAQCDGADQLVLTKITRWRIGVKDILPDVGGTAVGTTMIAAQVVSLFLTVLNRASRMDSFVSNAVVSMSVTTASTPPHAAHGHTD